VSVVRQMTGPQRWLCVSQGVCTWHTQPVSWNSSAGLECMGRYGGWGQSWGVKRPGISTPDDDLSINPDHSEHPQNYWPADSFDLRGVWAQAAACLHLAVVLPITFPRPLRSAEAVSLPQSFEKPDLRRPSQRTRHRQDFH